MMKLRVSRAAHRDLKEIALWTIEHFGDEQCEEYLRQLDKRLRALAKTPSRGRPCNDISPGLMKHHEGRHLIFYRVRTKTVDIIRVLHQSMDAATRFGSES